MTTRGIRRKKSYLVDAKIAVCGQKAVGKSGKYVVANVLLTWTWDEKQYANNRAPAALHEKIFVQNVHLEPFSEKKTLSFERKENRFVKLKFKHE